MKSKKSAEVTCTRCGHTGEVKSLHKGSLGMEVLLWILCFPIGIIYSIWRQNSKRPVCPECGCDDLIPANSPRATTMRAAFSGQA